MASPWRDEEALRNVLRAQAAYYALSGALPFVSMRLFEKITGPKTDKWLAQTVGLLALSISGSLYLAVRDNENLTEATVYLSSASALSFAAIDFYYGLTGKISPVYFADAGLECAILGALALAV